MIRRSVWAAFVVALGALAGSACGQPGAKKLPAGKTVVVLTDVSGSVRDREAISNYEDAFRKVVATLDPGDVLVVAWISARSESEPRLPINEVMPAVRKTVSNRLSEEAARKTAEEALVPRKKALIHRFDALLEAPERAAPTTDILGALELAHRIFESYSRSKRALVVLSDMVQESPELSLKNQALGPRQRSRLVGNLHRKGRIPRLSGVRVWVVGARNSEVRRFREIRSFWMEVFKAAGARLNEADYGGPLIRFETRPVDR